MGLVGVMVAVWGVHHWIKTAKPPPTNLRCANCPKLAAQIRMHWVGHFAWAIGLIATVIWGALR